MTGRISTIENSTNFRKATIANLAVVTKDEIAT